MSIGKWFSNLSFMKKMMFVYTLFAVLPMTFATAYNYRQTSEIIRQESYLDMQQSMMVVQSSLEESMQIYGVISDMLYANETLNSYLSMDYTNLSYWEMFYYIDTLLNSINIQNPNIFRISFYSTNETLPEDNYYFYRLEDMNSDFVSRANEKGGMSVVGGMQEQDGELHLGLTRKLNYRSSGEIENFLLLEVRTNDIRELLNQKDENREMLLIREDGLILAASETYEQGKNLTEYIPDWSGNGTADGERVMTVQDKAMEYLRQEIGMGASLVLLFDQESLLKEARAVAGRMMLIFFICSAVAFAAIFIYGRRTQNRVKMIVYASRKLGEGEFDYLLPDMGKDEIGEIANAYNLLKDRLQFLIRENYDKKLLIKSSEMNLLQEQINPHFLYNALAVISSMAMREGGKRTVESVRFLADFYRISLSKGKQEITVAEELEILKNYMKIQMIRFEESLEISYEVEEQVLQYKTIKLLLQPLVENAIHHGSREEGVLHIYVKISLQNDRIVYEVRDDGLGIAPEKLVQLRGELKKHQEGFGLRNVDIRVKLHYGEEYGVAIDSSYGKGTTIQVGIPGEKPSA